MNPQARLDQMLRYSMDVLLHPSIQTFRRYALRAVCARDYPLHAGPIYMPTL